MGKKIEGVTMTADEAHAVLGRDAISRGSFYNAIKRHEIPHIRLGKRILIPRHAFQKWLESAGEVGRQATIGGRAT